MPEYKWIPIEQLIEPPSPIRVSMDTDALASLAVSIKEIGVLQPLLVVITDTFRGDLGEPGHNYPLSEYIQREGLFEIIAGHRRYKACIIADLNAVPCLVFADAEIARHAAMLQENTEREDITPAEEAVFFAELIERHDYTEEQLLSAVKKSSSYVYSRLDLLRGNQEVFAALRDKKINMAIATQLNRCPDPGQTSYFLSLAINGGATAATVGKWVTEYKAPSQAEVVPAAGAGGDPTAPPASVAEERICVICRRSHQQLNLVPGWIHDWCLRQYEESIRNIGAVGV